MKDVIYDLKSWANEQGWYDDFSEYADIIALLNRHADWSLIYDPESVNIDEYEELRNKTEQIFPIHPIHDDDSLMGDGRSAYLCVYTGVTEGIPYLWIGAGCPGASAICNLHVAPQHAEKTMKLIYD